MWKIEVLSLPTIFWKSCIQYEEKGDPGTLPPGLSQFYFILYIQKSELKIPNTKIVSGV